MTHQLSFHQELLPGVTKSLLGFLLLAGGAGGASVSPSVTSSLYLYTAETYIVISIPNAQERSCMITCRRFGQREHQPIVLVVPVHDRNRCHLS